MVTVIPALRKLAMVLWLAVSVEALSIDSEVQWEESEYEHGHGMTGVQNHSSAKISVRFYGESQCPYCRQFVTEAWPQVWDDKELRSLVDYDFVPWGNAYWPIDECASGSSYDADDRACWYDQCISDGSSLVSDDCFAGDPIYQHSQKEGDVDVYETCVKELFGLEAAVSFTLCCEGPNMDDEKFATSENLLKECLPVVATAPVLGCAASRRTELEIENAKKTPGHPGVPFVVVDGSPLEDPLAVKTAVCDILSEHGDAPDACGKTH